MARSLLQVTRGLQLNGTRLDESLLSNLAIVVSGLAGRLEASVAQQAAQSAAQSAAVANVTAALAETQVRKGQPEGGQHALPNFPAFVLTRPPPRPGHARQRDGDA